MTTTELPEHLDYSARYELEIPPDVPWDTRLDLDWEPALLYDTEDVREFLVNGGLYHQQITGPFLIAYNYRFEIDRQDRIVAHGTAHPATQIRDDYHTDESAVMCEFTVIINPADPVADSALRRYIRAHCMPPPPVAG